MENSAPENAANKWLSVPLIATITRLLCRELTLQNEYLRQENTILKSKIKKRIVFTDDERRTLVEAALAMGKDLMEQIRHVIWECEDQGIKPRFFLRDNDVLYPEEMETILKASSVDTINTPFEAPNANAYAERYVLS